MDARATTRFFTNEGDPNPEILAFCRTAKPDTDVRDLEPGIRLTRWASDHCSLEITRSPAREEVIAVLRGWSQFDEGTTLDRKSALTVRFAITAEYVRVHWMPYVGLETIIGTNGQLLVGFDVSRVLGKANATAMRKAISPPYATDQLCNADGCDAYGPHPPGGARVRIGYLPRAGLMVTIQTTSELLPRLQELITASLGSGQTDSHEQRHIDKDGVRYEVRERSNDSVLDIVISKL